MAIDKSGGAKRPGKIVSNGATVGESPIVNEIANGDGANDPQRAKNSTAIKLGCWKDLSIELDKIDGIVTLVICPFEDAPAVVSKMGYGYPVKQGKDIVVRCSDGRTINL
jgi:hypothetical protein